MGLGNRPFTSGGRSAMAKGPVRLFREKARRPLGTPLAKTIFLRAPQTNFAFHTERVIGAARQTP